MVMSQAKIIQRLIVGVPLGMVVIGALALLYTSNAPKAEVREGGREEEMLREPVDEASLYAWVKKLSVGIGPRPAADERKMRITAKWIESELSEENMGYRPVLQSFEADGATYRNIEAEQLGGAKKDEIVVIGAHYDSVVGCPAANDNGTGVAAMLALARSFVGTENARTLRFVAFANEEPPHFQNPTMGSLVYAKACAAKDEKIVAMLSLETLGYYSDEKGSQQFPEGLRRFYPDTGNFVAFVGNERSKDLVEALHTGFTKFSKFPAEKAALREELPGVGWSDHWAFWQCGYPAAMATDTATYRYPHYHKRSDTIDKIDFPKFTEVVKGIAASVRELANP